MAYRNIYKSHRLYRLYIQSPDNDHDLTSLSPPIDQWKSFIGRWDIRKACPYVFPSHLSIKKESVTLKGLKGEHVPKIKIVLVGIRRFLIQSFDFIKEPNIQRFRRNWNFLEKSRYDHDFETIFEEKYLQILNEINRFSTKIHQWTISIFVLVQIN